MIGMKRFMFNSIHRSILVFILVTRGCVDVHSSTRFDLGLQVRQNH